jgi:hypothetical protein
MIIIIINIIINIIIIIIWLNLKIGLGLITCNLGVDFKGSQPISNALAISFLKYNYHDHYHH